MRTRDLAERAADLARSVYHQPTALTPLAKDDTVELQGYFRTSDGYFAADHTTFWGCKIG